MPLLGIDKPGELNEEDEQIAEEYAPGELAPSIVTPEKVWKPDDLKKADTNLQQVLTGLVQACSVTDEAARRFSVLQTWELRHMDRGYQYLEDNGRGGWSIAGTQGMGKQQNAMVGADDASLYATNVLSAQGDITTGALTRGEVKVNFFPRDSKDPQQVACAEEANKYKHIWAKNNRNLQRETVQLGWTDCRVVLWTRSVADRRFGLNEDGKPRIFEVTSPFGVLESKLPMMVDRLEDCGYVQLFEEMDYAVARATWPWMGDKIKPSWGTYGEQEFERIARINTRIGIVGKYITGTSGIREATIGYNWFRPGMYWDDSVTAAQREILLKEFPDGLFLIMAGPELVCAWNESLDDHVALGMYTRGFGQNRRALGSSDVSIQKRINIWADLWDKYVRGSIPITLLETKAFNAEAVAQQTASPTRFMEVALDDGQSMQEVVGQTPQAQPLPGMTEMLQWYVGPLIQSIDGATPALFGGGEGEDNTVGATQIRLQQSLERFGPTWHMLNLAFACAARQAVKCCAENGNTEISDNVPSYGAVSVNPQNLVGNPECEPETLAMIPQSGAQREAKVLSILDMANQNPQVASVVGTPSNAREIVKALHVDDVITIDEADSEDKQLEEIETLLETEPLLNPAWASLQQQIDELSGIHEQAKQVALAGMQDGSLSDDEVTRGAAMEQQVQELTAQLNQTPQYLPSVPVAQDESEDHATEAATVFSWMQQPEGRSLRSNARKEKPGGSMQESPNWAKWTNIYLHWQGHKEMVAKLEKAQAPPPRISMTGKLSPDQQAQLLQMQAGISTSPGQQMQPHEQETETIQRTPFAEVKTKTKRRL